MIGDTAETPEWRVVLASVPAGPATHAFMEQLTGELGLWSIAASRARRAVPIRTRKRLRIVQEQEVDEISILCPLPQTEAVLGLAVDVLGVDRPGGGMVHVLPVGRAIPMVFGAPQAEDEE